MTHTREITSKLLLFYSTVMLVIGIAAFTAVGFAIHHFDEEHHTGEHLAGHHGRHGHGHGEEAAAAEGAGGTEVAVHHGRHDGGDANDGMPPPRRGECLHALRALSAMFVATAVLGLVAGFVSSRAFSVAFLVLLAVLGATAAVLVLRAAATESGRCVDAAQRVIVLSRIVQMRLPGVVVSAESTVAIIGVDAAARDACVRHVRSASLVHFVGSQLYFIVGIALALLMNHAVGQELAQQESLEGAAEAGAGTAAGVVVVAALALPPPKADPLAYDVDAGCCENAALVTRTAAA